MSVFGQLARVRGHALWTPPLTAAPVVVDAGAHRGEFSRALHERFGGRCVLVEANPHLAAQLTPPPGGQVVHAALAADDGTARFVFRDNPEGGGIAARAQDAGHETAAVEMVSLATLRRRCDLPRIDVLKLDIEGAEFALLERAPEPELADIGQITVEFHDFLPEFRGRGLFEGARRRLERLGFVCCPMAFRTHGDVLFLNRRLPGLTAGRARCLSWGGRWVLKWGERRARAAS